MELEYIDFRVRFKRLPLANVGEVAYSEGDDPVRAGWEERGGWRDD